MRVNVNSFVIIQPTEMARRPPYEFAGIVSYSRKWILFEAERDIVTLYCKIIILRTYRQ